MGGTAVTISGDQNTMLTIETFITLCFYETDHQYAISYGNSLAKPFYANYDVYY